jgi:ferritin-like metal-binding protein YciE
MLLIAALDNNPFAIIYKANEDCYINRRNIMTHHLNDKFILYLNTALAIENAAIERLQSRIQLTILEDAKQQLQHHLEETREQQDRLLQQITKLGGTPTQEKAKLPISSPPESIAKTMENTMMTSNEERELNESIQDTIIENAEVTGYNMLIQMALKMNMADAIPSLRQNLNEEEEMFGWLRANAPAMFAKLWPQIERERLDLNSEVPSSSSSSSPPTIQDSQQKEDDEKYKGGSTTRHGGHLTVTTEAVSDRGNIAAAEDTVAEQKRDRKRNKTSTE